MNSRQDRKLTTILCADIAGYSRLMNGDESRTLDRLKETRRIFSDFLAQYSGRLVNMTGDGIVADFASVVNAVQCAVEFQNSINEDNKNIPSDDKMLFRVGLNLGDVIIEGDDIFGEGVNVASRLEALAPVGGICISGSVFDQVKNKLPRSFEFLGNKTVKNIAEPVAVYALSLTDEPQNLSTAKAATETDEDDAEIRAIVKRQAGFYRQAMMFGAIILLLFVINMWTSPGYWWFLWPTMGFAFALGLRAIRIFGKGPNLKDWEKRKINELKVRKREKG
ncbi:MAG: adenylate cyclase [Sneathiella sp.]|nr:MAG: adenylate cyclase [Sneathiella sp.]